MSEVKFKACDLRASAIVVQEHDFDRITADLKAALAELKATKIRENLLLNSPNNVFKQMCDLAVGQRNSLQQRLAAADERVDALEALLRDARHYHGVQLLTDPPKDAWKYYKVSERIDASLNPKPDTATDSNVRTWGPYYSTEVTMTPVGYKFKPAEGGGDE